jgi:chromo domain-containing protein 1
MPVNAKPKTNRFGLMSVGDYWWDNLRDEVLVHVYFGPEKHFIGPLKLCGIFRDVKKDLLLSAKSPRSSGLEMWFRHVCTAAEFERLYPPSVSFQFLNIRLLHSANQNLAP